MDVKASDKKLTCAVGYVDFAQVKNFHDQVKGFRDFGTETIVLTQQTDGISYPIYVNEYWTARQRQAHSLHEVSYRACFKPQLPRFFIDRLTDVGDVVYDPFMGRGTTVVEAALMGREALGCDINPLSKILCAPRLSPPQQHEVEYRLRQMDLSANVPLWEELFVFYHPDTLRALSAMREHFIRKSNEGSLDEIDAWIRMVATNRLTGHSPGFFSVYTLPPNQAVSIVSQKRINAKRNQEPTFRDVKKLIARKSKQLLGDMGDIERLCYIKTGAMGRCLTGNCANTPEIADASVSLVVTSPPFLDIVQYSQDNWLRCWFNGIDSKKVEIWQLRKAEEWQQAMAGVFRELWRILRPGGVVAFEVGEIRKGSIKMEDLVIPVAREAGFSVECVMINDQKFTKTANCWGVDNLSKGTNTNRIVILQK